MTWQFTDSLMLSYLKLPVYRPRYIRQDASDNALDTCTNELREELHIRVSTA
jgi:hypothetical protein